MTEPVTQSARRTVASSSGRPAAATSHRRRERRLPIAPWMFLAPFGLLFLVTFAAPIVYAVWQSFYTQHRSGLGIGTPRTVFAGISNYVTTLHDHAFLTSILRVILIGVVQVPVMLGLALILALILDAKRTSLKRFFRLSFFLPYAVPGIIGGLMWSFLYEPTVSPISAALSGVGLHVNFTTNAWLPWSIGNMLTWAWTGYNMLIIHSALQAIPGELTEAAELDGCTGWKLAWYVKVPMVRPALVMTTIFSIIGTAQLYNEPVVMQAIAPNLGSSWTPIMAAQNQVASNNYTLAATESVVLAVVTFILSFGFMRLMNRKGEAL